MPQKRNRIIIIGVKHGTGLDTEEFYKSLTEHKSKKKVKTVKDAIGNMPKLLPLDKVEKVGRCNVSHRQIDGEQIVTISGADKQIKLKINTNRFTYSPL